MRRRLSSLQTFFVKFVFPAIWITGWTVATVAMFFANFKGADESPKWFFLFILIVGVFMFYWTCMRLKLVHVDDDYLYVSNYLKEISIPLSDIYDVTENVWINSHPVTIHLLSPSAFGDKIVFMPPVRFFTFFSAHPVVEELKALANSKAKTAKFRW
jgi:hypothetical protein